jgi:hypothetical protein
MSQAETMLPPAIEQFIAGVNSFDSASLLEPFADDALLNDNHREFWGKAAIKEFTDREFIGDRVTLSITDVREHYGQFIVAAKTDGNYDKTNLPDPLILSFYFTLKNETIVTLIIIFNKASV